MSKIEHERPRHIAVRITAALPLPRAALADAVREAARRLGMQPAPRLTRYAFPHGAIRVSHEQQAAAVALLAGITGATVKGQAVAIVIEVLGVSGTLEALTRRHGILVGREA